MLYRLLKEHNATGFTVTPYSPESVTDPQILFLDEPTSGLDAFTALNIITTIKNYAREQNKVILMTVHQPRTDILNLFDKVPPPGGHTP